MPENRGKQCGQRFFTPLQNLKKGQNLKKSNINKRVLRPRITHIWGLERGTKIQRHLFFGADRVANFVFNLGQASPEEFPWICMMLTDQDRYLGSCAIIPESSDNDISSGTYRVITAAHRLTNKNNGLKQNE